MDYNKLSAQTWASLDKSGNTTVGYNSVFLSRSDELISPLHIFKDEFGKLHFAIEIESSSKDKIASPNVNGLTIVLNQYRLGGKSPSTFVDVCCGIPSYVEEFTQIIKEISKDILETELPPIDIVNRVISNWKTFWAVQNKNILSDEEQIGLICELITLQQLLKINPENGLRSWIGPLGSKHDFNFSEWTLEVKGTRGNTHSHTINGIDQLKPADNKKLAFCSFALVIAQGDHCVSLQSCILDVTNRLLLQHPNLIVRFNELIAQAGYSPLFSEEYSSLKVEIHSAAMHHVDHTFPKLTSDNLINPLDKRITSVCFNVSLDGLAGIDFDKVNWGNYFY